MKRRLYLLIFHEDCRPLSSKRIVNDIKALKPKWKVLDYKVGTANGLWNAHVTVEVPDDESEEQFVKAIQ